MTLIGAAAAKGYTTRARVKAQLGDLVQADSASDAVLDALILAASRAIDSYCSRTFGRDRVSEDLTAEGSVWLTLDRTPVLTVTQVLCDSAPVLDWTLTDPEAGILYRRTGFLNVLGPRELGWPNAAPPLATDLPPRYHVDYIGGFLLPADDVEVKTINVTASDQSYQDSASGLPLLVAGDSILASGFTNAKNNGWKTVVTATSSLITVTSDPAVVDEVAPGAMGGSRSLRVSTLPADLEQACLETVKEFWHSRQRDPDVTSKRVGDLAISYGRSSRLVSGAGEAGGTGGAANIEALPFRAIGLLKPWQRVV